MIKERTSDKLSMQWYRGEKDETKKKAVENSLRNSTTALGHLRDVIEDRLSELHNKSVQEDIYDSPSWAYKQAHYNGFIAGMKFIVDLLRFVPR